MGRMTRRWRCPRCGRDKFDRPYQPHWCNSNFRKKLPRFVEAIDILDQHNEEGMTLVDERENQIASCRLPTLAYMAAHGQALRRLRRGKRQVFCLTCQRWKWGDELCQLARYSGQPPIQR